MYETVRLIYAFVALGILSCILFFMLSFVVHLCRDAISFILLSRETREEYAVLKDAQVQRDAQKARWARESKRGMSW